MKTNAGQSEQTWAYSLSCSYKQDYYFLQDTLALRWRKWLTDQFMRRYFHERAFYQLGQGKVIDNPDQRIAEDINTFTGQSLFFATVVVGSVIQIIAFGGVLWSISPNLIYFLIGYSAFSSWFTAAVFGKPLIGLNFLQLQREADFRFGLVRVREYAEPIAFYDGEVREISLLQRMFSFVFNNQKRVLRCQLTYPHVGKTISDEEILHYLDLVNLSSLTTRCGGLGGELDWTKVLSIGEQQRLSFARALLTKPRYLLLDESTSALDAANESRLYAQLSGLDITPISVSHRQALLHHHHEVLVILGDSGWRMEQASEFKWDG